LAGVVVAAFRALETLIPLLATGATDVAGLLIVKFSSGSGPASARQTTVAFALLQRAKKMTGRVRLRVRFDRSLLRPAQTRSDGGQ
jgi:hypothetical protein